MSTGWPEGPRTCRKVRSPVFLALLQQEFGGHFAEAFLVHVDRDLVRAVDHVVEGDDDDALGIGLVHDTLEGGGVVGIDDDRIEALVDEVVGCGDLGGDVLAHRDDLELLDLLLHRRLFGISLGDPDHLHPPIVGDEAVDERDPVWALLGRPLEEFRAGSLRREAARIGAWSGDNRRACCIGGEAQRDYRGKRAADGCQYTRK